jgi:hypothetical protein
MSRKKEPYLTPMCYMLEVIKQENPEAYKELMEMYKNTPGVRSIPKNK